jgi:uncharacterized membrane protein
VEATRPSSRRRSIAAWGFGAGIALQVALVALGVAYIVAPTTHAAAALLFAWCIVGSGYVVAVWSVLAAASRWAETDQPPMVMELTTPSRMVALIATILSSAVGVVATVQHVVLDPGADDSFALNVIGIWAMILAWMLLHWGYAQLYLQRFYRSHDRPLRFPGTDAPGILEFGYFAYTVAVSLAASDVEVRDRAMRWRVLTHSVIGFFFNGLIIVTALEAITDVML